MTLIRNLLLVSLSIGCLTIAAQEDTLTFNGVQLDLLVTPTNPAFILMSTTPSEIVEPASAPEFYLSIQNASSNFTTFPNNYGFSVTPFWWTNSAKNFLFEKDFNTEQKLQLWRYLQLSAGVVKGVNDNENLWRYGAGFQTTLLPGKVNTRLKSNYDSVLTAYHFKFIVGKDKYVKQNRLYITYDSLLLILRNKIFNTSNQAEKDSLYAVYADISDLKIQLDNELGNIYNNMGELAKDSINVNETFSHMEKRVGLKIDIGGGLAGDAQNNKIDSLGMYRMGLWTNIGYTRSFSNNNCYISLIFLLRYWYYDDLIYFTDGTRATFGTLSVLDLGAKLQLDLTSKFSVAFEGIYRAGFDDLFNNTYKLNALAHYKFARNRLVFVSFGNAFNENSNSGPEQLIFNIGLNLGFGDDIAVYKTIN
jgi:hypothetical protein